MDSNTKNFFSELDKLAASSQKMVIKLLVLTRDVTSRITQERDTARMEICEQRSVDSGRGLRECANNRGWGYLFPRAEEE